MWFQWVQDLYSYICMAPDGVPALAPRSHAPIISYVYMVPRRVGAGFGAEPQSPSLRGEQYMSVMSSVESKCVVCSQAAFGFFCVQCRDAIFALRHGGVSVQPPVASSDHDMVATEVDGSDGEESDVAPSDDSEDVSDEEADALDAIVDLEKHFARKPDASSH